MSLALLKQWEEQQKAAASKPKPTGALPTVPTFTSPSAPKPTGTLPTAPAQPALQQAINQFNGGSPQKSQQPSTPISSIQSQSGPALNMANEQKYLESVLAQGGGAASWALNQAKSYGITLNQPTAQPAATPGGGTAAPKAAPAPAPTSGGGGAPGPTADPRDLPPADLEWLAQFNSQGQGQQGAPSPSSPEYIFNVATMIQGGLDEIRQQVDEKNMAFFNSLTNQFYTEFDAQLNSVMSTFQEQMGGVDPATKAALDQLRESTQEYRKTMMEDLNRRGLLQSGIAIESDLRLNKNQLTAEQQILAERVADLQNRMTSAMMQFSQSKLQAMQQFGVMGMNITQQGGQQQLDAFNTAMNQALSQANLQQGAFQADRAFQEGRRQFDQSFTENQRQFDEKMSMSQAEAEQAAKQFMATMGYNWANLSHKQQQDAISNEMKKQEMKFNQDQVTGAGETQRAIMLMQEYGSREEAMANFQRPEVIQEMIRLGVNVNEVYAAIQKMKSGGATPGSSFMPK